MKMIDVFLLLTGMGLFIIAVAYAYTVITASRKIFKALKKLEEDVKEMKI